LPLALSTTLRMPACRAHVLLLSWGTAPNAAALAAGPTVTTLEHCGAAAKVQPTNVTAADTQARALSSCALQGPAASMRGHANGTPPDGAGASTVSMIPLPVANAGCKDSKALSRP
jgi:hypothetical protein